jgi:TrmH family RNA methyltransferase
MHKTQRITAKDAAYQKFEVLKTNRNKRHRYNEFLVEGVRNINQAVKNNWQIKAFLYAYENTLSDWAADTLRAVKVKTHFILNQALMDELSEKNEPSELMAMVGMKSNADMLFPPCEAPIFVLFDRPSNKGNLGTLLRSCDAFGVSLMMVTGHGVDLYDPEVIGASMGSFFNVPFVRLSEKNEIDRYIASLKQQYPSLTVIGSSEGGNINIYDVDMTAPVLLLVGNEADGLNRYFMDMSDCLAAIPMSANTSASSFNVSCAATVMLYEVIRQRA